jgi:putative transposase
MIRMGSLLNCGTTYRCRMRAITAGDCFIDAACFEYFQRRLLGRTNAYRAALHAFCLLRRDVLLLVTPETPQAVNNLLMSLRACYGHYFALRFARSTRVFSTQLEIRPLDSPGLIIETQRFMERAGINNHQELSPGQHPWSSYSFYATQTAPPGLSLHNAWQGILPSGRQRPAAYRYQLASPLGEQRYKLLSRSLTSQPNKSASYLPAGIR